VLALFMESLNRGRVELFSRAGATSGIGHLRVVPNGWADRREPKLRLAGWQADLAAAISQPGVVAAVARVRSQALLAVGTHVVPVEMVGVDPEGEPKLFRYVQRVQDGRYLRADETNTIVIGKAIADRLTAGVGDDVVVTVVGPGGGMESALVRIVGIVNTGSDDADLSVCQVPRVALERLTGIPGAGEVSIVIDDYRHVSAIRAQLSSRVVAGDVVMTMSELAPDVEGHFRQDAASGRFVSFVIVLIVLLGVASAQLAAVLERRREFAVLSALGMSGGRMVRLVLEEALIVAVSGGALALAVGVPATWWLATRGLDFRRYFGTSFGFQGVLIDPVIFGDFGIWIVPYVFATAIAATVVASLYPAWFAARTDPAVALRVAQ
jgi:ABC-type lipoprotein release transport system permease subunit